MEYVSHVHPEDQATVLKVLSSQREKLPVWKRIKLLAERTGNAHGPVSMLWSRLSRGDRERRRGIIECCVSV